MSAASIRGELRQLRRPTRWGLASLLVSAALGYGAVFLQAYLEITSPSSMMPDVHAAETALFGSPERPVSAIERLLESSDGPMNGGGSMRPAFFQESDGWATLIENTTAPQRTKLMAERESERLALVDWVRSGANRESYERDDHGGVKIKTLIHDRCATCHSEDGRNDKARWFPLDAYERIAPYCQPESIESLRLKWLIASIVCLLPLALVTGPIFYHTGSSGFLRVVLAALPMAALAVVLGSWLLGRPGGYAFYAVLGAIAVAAVGISLQILASLRELLRKGG